MKYFLLIVFCLTLFSRISFAEEIEHSPFKNSKAIYSIIEKQIKPLLTMPLVIDSIQQQNAEHSALTQKDILRMDQQWRDEINQENMPLINSILQNNLSSKLAQLKEKSQGLFSEIFIMDNRGLNVAQSDITSDYWQGDEAKWQDSFLKGNNETIIISDVEFDDSSQTFQIQLSLPITDKTGTKIGAITVGIDAERLEWLNGEG